MSKISKKGTTIIFSMVKMTKLWLLDKCQIHDINATDLLSILARQTGQLTLILAEQSSHRQT